MSKSDSEKIPIDMLAMGLIANGVDIETVEVVDKLMRKYGDSLTKDQVSEFAQEMKRRGYT